MDKMLLALIITLIVVFIVCIVVAIIKQKLVKNCTVSGADNHVMDGSKYSGKYSVCKEIGEADDEL